MQALASAGSQRLLGHGSAQRCAAGPRQAAVRPCSTRPGRRALSCKAVVATEVAEAVTQQAIAFAIVLGAEAAFSRSNVPEGDPGAPQIPLVGAGVGGSLLAALLIGKGGGFIPSVGLVVGFLASGAMLYASAQRAANLQYSDGDWPGPKAWPTTMALISFFAVCVFLQAVVADLGTAV